MIAAGFRIISRRWKEGVGQWIYSLRRGEWRGGYGITEDLLADEAMDAVLSSLRDRLMGLTKQQDRR